MLIRLDKIRIDGQTQVREQLDQKTVDNYAERMTEGDKLPPIVVYHDGKDQWLSEGFHRYFAAKKADWKDIEAEQRKGTVADARWNALASNRGHGLPMNNADKRRAVQMALEAKPTASDRSIADHVGVSAPFVASVRAQASGASVNGLQIESTESREVTRKGKTYTQNTSSIGKKKKDKAEPDPKPEPVVELEPLKPIIPPLKPAKARENDAVGQDIPDALAHIFARSREIEQLLSAIQKIKATISGWIDEKDPIVTHLHWQSLETDLKNAYQSLKAATPYAVCVYCAGSGCQACRNQGWTGKLVYVAAPASMKAGHK
jgi:hypothetical protein